MSNVIERENVIIAFFKENWRALKEALAEDSSSFEQQKITDEELLKTLNQVEKIEEAYDKETNTNASAKKNTGTSKKNVVAKAETKEIPKAVKNKNKVKEKESDREI